MDEVRAIDKLIGHLKTVGKHRKEVRKACWKMGLFWQGLVHDLTKYSVAEMGIWRYWTGKGSPHQVCREEKGWSPSWVHHYHSKWNKHHFQYFWDEDESGEIIPMKMPWKYVVESFCDMVGAGKAYLGDKWNCGSPLKYWKDKCQGRLMNECSACTVGFLCETMAELGEDEFYRWFRENKNGMKILYELDGVEKEKDGIKVLFEMLERNGEIDKFGRETDE